ncbi:hypothetical protein L1987_53549 [Smallanthus sonchifolius]|uniref:Uncharacterized protein n=1 Tax=Smallanthus sonchifolius TaxID=185202 RepID=A0ACB9EW55_9ASTR|nr:hypothetical protein L1987_53549 [Smallanthus sonchifolius]
MQFPVTPPACAYDELKTLFEEWVIKQGKFYNNLEDKEMRLQLFRNFEPDDDDEQEFGEIYVSDDDEEETDDDDLK